MAAEDFVRLIDFWISGLENYDDHLLRKKPSDGSWSIGQVYMHLLSETNHFLRQAKICASKNDHENDEMTPEAMLIFKNRSFPDQKLIGPPSNDLTPQPESREKIIDGLLKLKSKIIRVESILSKSNFKGKTIHPGFNYFSAREWFQFAEMHFRHHLRQKKRIDAFLRCDKNS